MIACRNCGSHNPSDAEFCGTCDEFLEWNGEQVAARDRAVPAAVPPGRPDDPAPVQPQHRKRTGQPVAVEPERPEEGDRRCPRCRFGNGPGRHFCARCGEVLAPAAAPAPAAARVWWPVRWWRALWGYGPHPVLPAGTRPLPGGVPPSVLAARAAVALVAAAVLLYAAVPAVRTGVDDAVTGLVSSGERAIPADATPVRPVRVSATAADAGHPADAAADGVTTTFWAASGPQPALDLVFDRPVVVDRAILRLGGTDQVQAWSRPRILRLTYSDGRTQELTVADQLDPQTVALDASAPITWMRVEVAAVYPSPTNPDVAVTEIELFGRGAS